MWAHYANNFEGLAIELKLPTDDLHEVTYASTIPDIVISDDLPQDPLSSKAYEIAK